MTATNALYWGDNLTILRQMPSGSVDLVYLDPPFNSNRAYNVLFKEKSGADSPAQIRAFTDTWTWDSAAEHTMADLIQGAPPKVAQAVGAMRQFIGSNDLMAYLVMMAVRLAELHRVLKPTGSLYLHCDPAASHYLKVLLDAIVGPKYFRNEIVWKRTSAHSSARRFGPVHDCLLFYSKGEQYTWNPQYARYSATYLAAKYRHRDQDGRAYRLSDLTGAGVRHGATGLPWRGFDPSSRGRHWMRPPDELDRLDEAGRVNWPAAGGWPSYKRYLHEVNGMPLQDVWADLDPLNSQAVERLGFPTQKPLALLERIIAASSNPGDVVLDPFCGCGTAIIAAQKLSRRWVGIDITHLAVALMRYRLKDAFGEVPYTVHGLPVDLESARALAVHDRYQFQWWAISLVRAKPLEGTPKKGADQGIDGVINFIDDASGQVKTCLVQVKSGSVGSKDIRDLKGTMQGKAELGIFITLEPPTPPMRKEAVSAGVYHSPGWGSDCDRIQILTIEQLLNQEAKQTIPGSLAFNKGPQIQVPQGVQLPLAPTPGMLQPPPSLLFGNQAG